MPSACERFENVRFDKNAIYGIKSRKFNRNSVVRMFIAMTLSLTVFLRTIINIHIETYLIEGHFVSHVSKQRTGAILYDFDS